MQRLALRLVLAAIILAIGATVRMCRAEAAAQDRTLEIVGVWEGVIEVSGASLDVRLEFFSEPPTYVWGTIDIPAQNASGLRLRSVHIEGTHVTFDLPLGTVAALFDGTFEGDRMSGAFTQGPATGAFRLARVAAAEAPIVPYAEESLRIDNGDVSLGGTLTLPEGAGPFPAVVLLSGSGPQTRDEEVFGFKVFATLADHLTRAGIAVLRYDDRGVGESTGSLADTTSADMAGDALAWIEALASRGEIDGDRIGLLGHSAGASAAAIAASRSRAPAFVVMLAGPGVRGDRVLRRQAEDGARALGAGEAAVARISEAHRRSTEAALAGASREELIATARALIIAQVAGLPPARRAAVGDVEAFADQRAPLAVAQLTSPAMRFLLGFDPATTLADVACPVLAVFGELDTQVPPSLNRAPVEAALASNPRGTVRVYPEANHLFQRARTGLITEYATLEKTFVDGLLDDLTAWMLEAAAR